MEARPDPGEAAGEAGPETRVQAGRLPHALCPVHCPAGETEAAGSCPDPPLGSPTRVPPFGPGCHLPPGSQTRRPPSRCRGPGRPRPCAAGALSSSSTGPWRVASPLRPPRACRPPCGPRRREPGSGRGLWDEPTVQPRTGGKGGCSLGTRHEDRRPRRCTPRSSSRRTPRPATGSRSGAGTAGPCLGEREHGVRRPPRGVDGSGRGGPAAWDRLWVAGWLRALGACRLVPLLPRVTGTELLELRRNPGMQRAPTCVGRPRAGVLR